MYNIFCKKPSLNYHDCSEYDKEKYNYVSSQTQYSKLIHLHTTQMCCSCPPNVSIVNWIEPQKSTRPSLEQYIVCHINIYIYMLKPRSSVGDCWWLREWLVCAHISEEKKHWTPKLIAETNTPKTASFLTQSHLNTMYSELMPEPRNLNIVDILRIVFYQNYIYA